MAAACILERYIEDEGVGSILARQCPYPPPEEIATFNYTLIGTYVGMRHHVEDSEDWHKVKAYVNNYKVLSFISLSIVLRYLVLFISFYFLFSM